MNWPSARSSRASGPRSTTKRAPAIFAAAAKSIMPSASPSSKCCFGWKPRSRGSPCWPHHDVGGLVGAVRDIGIKHVRAGFQDSALMSASRCRAPLSSSASRCRRAVASASGACARRRASLGRYASSSAFRLRSASPAARVMQPCVRRPARGCLRRHRRQTPPRHGRVECLRRGADACKSCVRPSLRAISRAQDRRLRTARSAAGPARSG